MCRSFLLLLALAFHGVGASCGNVAAQHCQHEVARELPLLDTSLLHHNNFRRLRRVEEGSPETEDRGLLTWISQTRQVNKWAKTGKSDAYVKKALQLDELSDEAMVVSPQYKYYMKFWFKTEPERLAEWLEGGRTGLTTAGAWRKLGLENMRPGKRESSAAYKAYLRYAAMYDDGMFQRVLNGELSRSVVGSYPEETSALVRLWVAKERPLWYVKSVLGLAGNKPVSKRGQPFLVEYNKLLRKNIGNKKARPL